MTRQRKTRAWGVERARTRVCSWWRTWSARTTREPKGRGMKGLLGGRTTGSVHKTLRHTARQATASPSRYAIRGRFVNRVLRLGVPALGPDRGAVTRPPLPSAGSSWDECRRLRRYYEGLRPLPPRLAVLWCSPGDTRVAPGRSLPPGPDAAPAGRESFGSGHSLKAVVRRGTTAGLSGSWGTLVCVGPVLGPRQDRYPRPIQDTNATPPLVQTVGSLREA
jgi:hypothetical protein